MLSFFNLPWCFLFSILTPLNEENKPRDEVEVNAHEETSNYLVDDPGNLVESRSFKELDVSASIDLSRLDFKNINNLIGTFHALRIQVTNFGDQLQRYKIKNAV